MIVLLAAAATLPFAPPLDRTLRYEVTERRPREGGGQRTATLDEAVRFSAEPGGYAMTITTTGYRGDAGDAVFDAAMKPMVGTVVRVHVSAGGVPEWVIDGAVSWNAMLAALRVQIAGATTSAERVTATRMLATLEAAPPEVRDARLLGAADDVLAARMPPLAVGERAVRDEGAVVREPDVDGGRTYHETVHRLVPGAPGRTLDEDSRVTVSHDTGLVTHSLRRTSMGTVPVGESEIRLVADLPR